jgi:hypothetical protein
LRENVTNKTNNLRENVTNKTNNLRENVTNKTNNLREIVKENIKDVVPNIDVSKLTENPVPPFSWSELLNKDIDNLKYDKNKMMPMAIYSLKLIETADLFFNCIFAPFIRVVKDNLLELKNENNTEYNRYIYQVITNIKEKAKIEDEKPRENDTEMEKKAKMIINGMNELKNMKNSQITSAVETGIGILKKIVKIQAILYTMILPIQIKFSMYPLYIMAKLMIVFLKFYVSIFKMIITQITSKDLPVTFIEDMREMFNITDNKPLTKELLREKLESKLSMITGMIDVIDVVSKMLIERSSDELVKIINDQFDIALNNLRDKCP